MTVITSQPAPNNQASPDQLQQLSVWWALAALAVSAVLANWLIAPPAAKPATAPPAQFSAERAAATLTDLLGPGQPPHPTGSIANAAVRDRLMDKLSALGLQPELQRAIGCAAQAPRCGQVENVIAELPGTSNDAVVVMVHYDSVPPSPGAGDDGAGVAAVLESLRAILSASTKETAAQAQAPSSNQPSTATHTNSLIALFTDGEELGLLGAEAFFTEHPLRSRVHAVINLEGAGSGGGPVTLLRTANRAGQLVDAYRAGSEHPAALSIAQEVFSRMPNDTDFSVANRAGIPSIDFAFASEFSHYHTPLDTLENLSRDSLQHHGDSLLPLLNELRTSDLRVRDPGYVYQTMGSLWFIWPTPLSIWLALAAAGLLLFSTWRLQLSVGAVATSAVLATLGLVAALLVCAGMVSLARSTLGMLPNFPADWRGWAVMLCAAAAFPYLLISQLGRQAPLSATVGLWLVVSVLALLLATTAPLAANLLILPALLMSILICAAAFAAPLLPSTLQPGGRPLEAMLLVLACAVMGYLFLGLAPVMAESQGLGFAPAIYAMVAIGSWPLVVTRGASKATLAAALVALGGLLWVLQTPLYSANRPQSVSIHYQQNTDKKEASWIAYSDNPLPERLRASVGYSRSNSLRFPWETRLRDLPRAQAEWVEISGGELRSARNSREIRFTYLPDPSVEHVSFVFPGVFFEPGNAQSGGSLSVNGHQIHGLERASSEPVLFRFYAPPKDGITVVLTPATSNRPEVITPNSTLYLVEGRSGLPPSARPQLEARSPTAVAQHQGDQWLTYRRIVTP